MHKIKTTLLNCSTVKDQNHSKKRSAKEHRQNCLSRNSRDQPVAFWGLAVAIGAFGGIVNFPQMAQASPTQPSVTNYHSSNLIVQSVSEPDFAIAETSKFKTEQSLKIPRTDINSATTISVPQLPSFSLAQNSVSKTITKQIYTVRAGDTLSSIARLYGVSPDEIIKANKIKNPHRLPVNQQLIIPLKETAQVSSDINRFSASNPISERTTNNRINPRVTRDISTNLSTNQESQANLRDPYISRLRADIDQLRNQFQSQYNNEESEVSINDSSPSISRESLEPNYVPNPVSSENLENRNATLENNSSSEEVFISSTINSLLDSPLRDRLRPQLPPLASPEEYLPDNSNIFNGYMWPAQGTFTSGYGWRWGRMHKGIDIAAPIGTPILAAATGEVIFAGWNSGGYGNLVKIKHPDGSVTFYAHNNKIFVRRGQKIKQGQQIAEMGSTGYSTGPHLHFEIRTNGTKAVNPIALLPKK